MYQKLETSKGYTLAIFSHKPYNNISTKLFSLLNI